MFDSNSIPVGADFVVKDSPNFSDKAFCPFLKCDCVLEHCAKYVLLIAANPALGRRQLGSCSAVLLVSFK